MKKFIITIALFSLVFSAFAQQGQRGGTPEERAKRMTDRMKTEFNLTDTLLIAKADSINLAYEMENQKIRQDTTIAREQRFEKMGPMRDKRNEAMKAILTEEQYKVFMEQMQRRRPGGGGPPGGGTPQSGGTPPGGGGGQP